MCDACTDEERSNLREFFSMSFLCHETNWLDFLYVSIFIHNFCEPCPFLKAVDFDPECQFFEENHLWWQILLMNCIARCSTPHNATDIRSCSTICAVLLQTCETYRWILPGHHVPSSNKVSTKDPQHSSAFEWKTLFSFPASMSSTFLTSFWTPALSPIFSR